MVTTEEFEYFHGVSPESDQYIFLPYNSLPRNLQISITGGGNSICGEKYRLPAVLDHRFYAVYEGRCSVLYILRHNRYSDHVDILKLFTDA